MRTPRLTISQLALTLCNLCWCVKMIRWMRGHTEEADSLSHETPTFVYQQHKLTMRSSKRQAVEAVCHHESAHAVRMWFCLARRKTGHHVRLQTSRCNRDPRQRHTIHYPHTIALSRSSNHQVSFKRRAMSRNSVCSCTNSLSALRSLEIFFRSFQSGWPST